jgi:hypothetical protein
MLRRPLFSLSLGLLLLGTAGLAASPALAEPAKAAAKSAAAPQSQWHDLTAQQQKALQPLSPHWDQLPQPQKRKWLALSRNYDHLSPANQTVLHSRMTEWAGLSKQQRAQARLNFADIKQQVPAHERKAKWEAYQALSAEEKSKLAAQARTAKTPKQKHAP